MRYLLIMIGVLAMSIQAAHANENDKKADKTPQWSLVIHGGAGVIRRDRMTPEKDAAVRTALNHALDAGSQVLKEGGTAMDAVQAAITILEDSPQFNAGRGAVFTYDEKVELDAAIMDGQTREAGAVAQVTKTKNPIKLARKVMEESKHVMLAAGGADEFSMEQGLEQVDNSYFQTEERLEQVRKLKEQKLGYFDVDMKYGTVGAVAMDQHGNLAAGTSTGGITGKRWGRVGDSPIIGAGTYADNRACAISATGSGEYFIRLGVAHEICARMRLKEENAKAAADHVIEELTELGGTGGVIVVAPDGTAVWSYNSKGMYRGRATSATGKTVSIYGDEE